ncbi:fructosamine kinase family protein [Enterococcus pseudoavium]|uniref:Fructosamine kinase family protein n=1 Tax=Enterococcus pseudoavium TaxID=44007 RepID=A0ABU3FL05_9ENTE|nr:fructosamine kinase family protein [Enterococcus pseudoavium]MDT2754681.1 fructosamine kinase family protein [Enterococcus pseudoavium]MDT2771769.1 fructosamine kinase family protein [Enterococcus pseudoavium]
MEALLKQLELQTKAIPIGGGDINQAYRVTDGQKDYFLKYHPQMSADFFQAEVDGLAELAEVVHVPKVYRHGSYADAAFLLMEWIEPGEGDQKDLARELSKVHGIKALKFGYKRNNFMGLLPQINTRMADWWDFYFTNRLEVQIKIAQERNRWNTSREKNYQLFKERVYQKWGTMSFEPTLLHGDFWSGNTFFDRQGQPIFIDPAVSFGHREMDLAMAQLFGGFRREFIASYQEIAPMRAGWQERLTIYQLYYLLVHLNIFGESYGEAVDRSLSIG